MPIPITGQIAFSDIQDEFGGINPIAFSEYYANGPYVAAGVTGVNGPVPESGEIKVSDFKGTSSNEWIFDQSLPDQVSVSTSFASGEVAAISDDRNLIASISKTTQNLPELTIRKRVLDSWEEEKHVLEVGLNENIYQATGTSDFAYSVAISKDNTTIAIARRNHSVRIYINNNGTWESQHTFAAPATGNFGEVVKLSDDGNTVAISAPNETVDANADAGRVYVATRTGITWSSLTEVERSVIAANDEFGNGLGLSGNGQKLFANTRTQELAYIFKYNGTEWAEQSNTVDGFAGQSGEIDASYLGDVYAVASDFGVNNSAVYIEEAINTKHYVESNPGLILTNEEAGYSLDITRDGSALMVGKPGNISGSSKGGYIIYEKHNDTWNQIDSIYRATDGDRFGESVAIAQNKEYAVIGEPQHSKVWIRQDFGSSPFLYNIISGVTNGAGRAIKLASDDTRLFVSIPDRLPEGAVNIYTHTGTDWSINWTLEDSVINTNAGSTTDEYGDSLATNAAGDVLFVGVPGRNTNTGAVEVWTRTGTTWSFLQTLTRPGGTTNEYFGHDIHCSSDGRALVVGTLGGHVEYFENTSTNGGYNFVHSSSITAGNYTGYTRVRVADTLDTIVVSMDARQNSTPSFATDSSINDSTGGTVIYKKQGEEWVGFDYLISETYPLTAQGRALAISTDANVIAVGSPTYNTNSGTFSIYEHEDFQAPLIHLIMPDDFTDQGRFGINLAVSRDDTTMAVVGQLDTTPGFAEIYVYKRTYNKWNFKESFTVPFVGSASEEPAIAINGDGTAIAYTYGTNLYIYEYNGATWDQTPFGPGFGTAAAYGVQIGIKTNVKISLDGNEVYWGINASVDADARVKVFTKINGTWQETNQVFSVLAYPGPGEKFGYSLDVSDDGNRMLVGSPMAWDNVNGANRFGYITFFEKINGVWSQLGSHHNFVNFNNENEQFGHRVCLSADGTRGMSAMAQNASGLNDGVIRIYDIDELILLPGYQPESHSSEIIENTAATNLFGRNATMSKDGRTIYESHLKKVYTFDDVAPFIKWTARIDDQSIFGTTFGAVGSGDVALSYDGRDIYKGDITKNWSQLTEHFGKGSIGGVYWATFDKKFTHDHYSPDLSATDLRFGHDCVMSKDGTVAVIKDEPLSVSGNRIYIYTKVDGEWYPILPDIITSFNLNTGIAISDDGAHLIIYNGTSYLRYYSINKNARTFVFEQSIPITTGSSTGAPYSVAMSGDSNVLYVYADTATFNVGEIQRFTRTGATWTYESTLPDPASKSTTYGNTLSTNYDGTVVVVGETISNPANNSRAVIFEFDTVWTITELTESYDNFAYDVVVSGDGATVFVHEIYDTGGGSARPKLHIYRKVLGAWTEVDTVVFSEEFHGYNGQNPLAQYPNSRSHITDCSFNGDVAYVALAEASLTGDNYITGTVLPIIEDAGSWSIADELYVEGDTGNAEIGFGLCVGCNNDGSSIVAGSAGFPGKDNDEGGIHFFEGLVDTQIATYVYPITAGSVAVARNGQRVVYGEDAYDYAIPGNDHGRITILTRNENTWDATEIQYSNPIDGDRFGSQVEISSNGNLIIASKDYQNVFNDEYKLIAYRYENNSWLEYPVIDGNGFFTLDNNVLGMSDDVTIVTRGATDTAAIYDFQNPQISLGEDPEEMYIVANRLRHVRHKEFGGTGDVLNKFRSLGVNVTLSDAVISKSRDDTFGSQNTNIVNTYIIPRTTSTGDFQVYNAMYLKNTDLFQDSVITGASVSVTDNAAEVTSIDHTLYNIVIGISNDEQGANHPGSVRLLKYSTNDSQWNESVFTNGEDLSEFGYRVSMDAGAFRFAVSAPNSAEGKVYIYAFDGNNYVLEETIVAPSASNERFGENIKLSKNGLHLAITDTRYDGTSQTDRGIAYVYKYNVVSDSWIFSQELSYVGDLNNDNIFSGSFIDMSQYGDTIVVGTPNQPLTSFNVYERIVPPGFALLDTITSVVQTTITNDSFVVSANGSTMAVLNIAGVAPGNEYVKVYKFDGETWTFLQLLQPASIAGASGTDFGRALDITDDGSRIIIGAPKYNSGATESGEAYLYEESGGTYSLIKTYTPGTPQTNGHYGFSVSISRDGGESVIGHPGDGTRYVGEGSVDFFKPADNAGSANYLARPLLGHLNMDFGTSVSLNKADDGDIQDAVFAVGAPSKVGDPGGANYGLAGAIYVYEQDSATITGSDSEWVRSIVEGTAANQELGRNVHISRNTKTIASVYDDTKLKILEYDTPVSTSPGDLNGWSNIVDIDETDAIAGDEYGSAIFASATGNTVFVGAKERNGGDGAIFHYTKSEDVWTRKALKLSPVNAADSKFGGAISQTQDEKTIFAFSRNDFYIYGRESTFVQYIWQPTIVTPAYDETDVIVTDPITSSSFYALVPGHTHALTDWQIATDDAFTNIVEQSMNDNSNLTSYTPTSLSINTVYYVRVRYYSQLGEVSLWSPVSKFTTETGVTTDFTYELGFTDYPLLSYTDLGNSVRLSDDGNTLVINAESGSGTGGSTAHDSLFVLKKTNIAGYPVNNTRAAETWHMTNLTDNTRSNSPIHLPTDFSATTMGNNNVRITGDGLKIFCTQISADDIMLEFNGTSWAKTRPDIPTGINTINNFDVDFDGDVFAYISSNTLYIREWNGSGWPVVFSDTIGFTSTSSYNSYNNMQLTPDGTKLLVGFNSTTPQVNLYENTGTWSLSNTFTASDTPSTDQYGLSVDMDDTGTLIAVGSPLANKLYIYEWTGSVWNETIMNPPGSESRFGEKLGVPSDGSFILANLSTAVHENIHKVEKVLGTWTVTNNETNNFQDVQLNDSVFYVSPTNTWGFDLSKNGETFALGSPGINPDKVYVFNKNVPSFNQTSFTITAGQTGSGNNAIGFVSYEYTLGAVGDTGSISPAPATYGNTQVAMAYNNTSSGSFLVTFTNRLPPFTSIRVQGPGVDTTLLKSAASLGTDHAIGGQCATLAGATWSSVPFTLVNGNVYTITINP